jgi:PhoD-like phosphatase
MPSGADGSSASPAGSPAWPLPQLAHRFGYRDDLSPVGRTRTAPRRTGRNAAMSFTFASCQDWGSGYYSAYRHLAEEDLDLVLHLGDYVYEGYEHQPVRRPANLRQPRIYRRNRVGRPGAVRPGRRPPVSLGAAVRLG